MTLALVLTLVTFPQPSISEGGVSLFVVPREGSYGLMQSRDYELVLSNRSGKDVAVFERVHLIPETHVKPLVGTLNHEEDWCGKFHILQAEMIVPEDLFYKVTGVEKRRLRIAHLASGEGMSLLSPLQPHLGELRMKMLCH